MSDGCLHVQSVVTLETQRRTRFSLQHNANLWRRQTSSRSTFSDIYPVSDLLIAHNQGDGYTRLSSSWLSSL